MNPPPTPHLEGLQFALITPAPDGRSAESQVLGNFSDREDLVHDTGHLLCYGTPLLLQ